LTKGGNSTVEKSVSASQSLAGLEVCANAEALRAVMPPPKDEATRAKVQKLRERVAEVNALGLAGRYKEQLPIAEQAAADVGQIKYRPIEAEVFLALANARHINGAPKEAETLILNAIFAAEAGRHDELAVKAWLLFAHWQSALEGREIEQARESVAHANALLERMGGDALLQADLDSTLGHVEFEGGNYEKAHERYDAALIGYEKLWGPEHHSVAQAIEHIASVARRQGRHEEALNKSKRALALLEKALGPHHPRISGALTSIGMALENRGDFVEAQKAHERALEISEKSYGPDHNNTAIALMNLANVLGENGKPDQAITMYNRALGIQEKQYGVGHVKTATILMNIGATLTQVNRFEESVPYFEKSLVIQEKAKGSDYVELCIPLSNLGGALVILRRLDEALEPFQRALNLARKVHGDKHPYIADALVGIGMIYIEKRQALQAIQMLEEAMTMRISLDEDPMLIAEAKYQLGRAYWDSAKNKLQAIELVKEAQKLHKDNPARNKRNALEIDGWLRKNAAH
jgi:eukaryotic-like serine/threonine-protein kinase